MSLMFKYTACTGKFNTFNVVYLTIQSKSYKILLSHLLQSWPDNASFAINSKTNYIEMFTGVARDDVYCYQWYFQMKR